VVPVVLQLMRGRMTPAAVPVEKSSAA
jgi:hypothetical protein